MNNIHEDSISLNWRTYTNINDLSTNMNYIGIFKTIACELTKLTIDIFTLEENGILNKEFDSKEYNLFSNHKLLYYSHIASYDISIIIKRKDYIDNLYLSIHYRHGNDVFERTLLNDNELPLVYRIRKVL